MREADEVNKMQIIGAFCHYLLRLDGGRSGTERTTKLSQYRNKQVQFQGNIVHQIVIDETLLQQFGQIVVWQAQQFHCPGRYDGVAAADWMHSVDALKPPVDEHLLQWWLAWRKR